MRPLTAVVLILYAWVAAAQSGVGTPRRTSFDGRALEFDFPAIHIGVAEYDEGPTGTTVFYFPEGAVAAVDVRGGAPGTIGTDSLQLSYESSFVDAICFAGGSSYGLEAATGVSAELRAMRGNSGNWSDIAFVAGAIIFDLGPRRFNTTYPDKELGRAALRAAKPGRFPLGARGAGRFATQGGFFGGWEYRQYSGQGAAFRQSGPTKVAVFTVVNSLGAIADRQGRLVRCFQSTPGTPCGSISDYLADALRRRSTPRTSSHEQRGPLTESTTITLVVTNQKLDFWALKRLAVQVHASMARAIQPFHTENDGDVLFAATTKEVDNDALAPEVLGLLASEVAWDAILNSVPELPAQSDQVIQLDVTLFDEYVGRYEFAPGAALTISRDGDRLIAEATGERDIYSFKKNMKFALSPVSRTEFISDNLRRDRLKFSSSGLVLNPGHWGLPARRVPRVVSQLLGRLRFDLESD